MSISTERPTSLRLLQAAAFTSSFDRLMIAPMLVVIAVELDGSVEAVSQAAAAYLLCYGIAQICWAMVSARCAWRSRPPRCSGSRRRRYRGSGCWSSRAP